MSEKSQHILLRWAKRILWGVVCVLLLGMVLRLSLKTKVVQDWAKGVIESSANEQLIARLTIEDLTGDLWKEVTLTNLSLTQQDTVASVDSVHAQYDIWSVLAGTIEVSELGIYQPNIRLNQQKGRWNVQDLVKTTDQQEPSGEIPSFRVDRFRLSGGNISVASDSLPLESSFTITELELESSIGFSNRSYDVDLRNLSFSLVNTQLDQPLKVQTAATASQEKVTLEKLVLASGNSLVESYGFAHRADSSIKLDFSASPIAWKDIATYSNAYPLRENLEVDLSLSGRPAQFEVGLTVLGNGLDSLKVNGGFKWQPDLVLNQLQASANSISFEELFADTTLPSLRDLSLNFQGRIEASNVLQASGEIDVSANEISRGAKKIDQLSAKGSINSGLAELQIQAKQQQQKAEINIRADQIWSELPSLNAKVMAFNIDPAYWLDDTTYSGDISFRSEFSGQGWYPQKKPWKYSLSMSESRVMGQPITTFSAKGKLLEQGGSITAELKIREGLLKVTADLREIMTTPTYNYDIETQDLDLGALFGRQDFETSVNSRLVGSGWGFDPASMRLNTSLAMDSSLVNKELIRNLSADLTIRDTIAVIDTARLQSTIAEGSFDLRFNILRRFDSGNKLDFDLSLKDLTALGPLADVDTLRAEGEIAGNLSPMENGNLRFLGTLNLSNVQYNRRFTAERAQGSLDIRAEEGLNYLTDLNLIGPTFSGVKLQDLALITRGNYYNPKATGQFEFRFSSPNEGRLEQAGSFTLAKDSIYVLTREFNIISDYRTLTLEKPFELRVKSDSLTIDTLRVSSGDGAFLEMGAPLISEQEQRGFLRGKSLNTAVIQSCLLGEVYFKGLMSGEFAISRKDTSLKALGSVVLSEMEYQDARFDSLKIAGSIEDERMEGTLALHHESRKLIDGTADLPFKLGDPKDFSNSFFKEPVSGTLRVREIDVARFKSLIAQNGLTGTSGLFSFEGILKGTAGDPEFSADATLREAQLSGVTVDSVKAGLNYNHENAKLQLDASVMSLRQKAAQIDARFPLFVNMKTFRVDLPQPEDSMSVNIETNNFNLQALNDFVDRRTLREVSGQLNATVRVTGEMGNLKTEGEMVLNNAGFRLLPAGIKVERMKSKIDFRPNEILLTNFSAKSGRGNLTAQGRVAIEALVPGNMDIKIKANNFRVANTSKHNAVVDLDARATGNMMQPKVNGSLNFVSGFLMLQNFGEKSVETVRLDSADEVEISSGIYDSLALDMDVNFNRRFFIRNERYLEMEIELDGELDLVKQGGMDPELFGTITTPSGYARPFGKEFTLKEGTVRFSGEPTNPELLVRTEYEPPQTQENIKIWYIIEGTVEDPRFKYESQPPMELENIISYTLFGQPFYALDSWKQVVASSGSNTTAADVALDVLLDRVEALATQKLGIDVVKIDNSRVGGETGTSITTGWYLNPKVFFAIQNVITGSTPDTGFLLEYMLRDNLKLILRQGNGIRQGVDLKWNYEY